MKTGEKSKIKKICGIIFLIIVIILGFTVAYFLNKEIIRQDMTNYLNKRYNGDFLVGKPSLKGNEGFGYHVYKARAGNKKTNEIFSVQYDTDSKKYNDNYLVTKWYKDSKEYAKQKIEEIMGEEIVWTGYNFGYNAMIENRDIELIKNWNYKQALDNKGENMYWELGFAVFRDKDIDKKTEAEKGYRILKEMKLDRLTLYRIYVTYYSNKIKENILKKIEDRSGIDTDKLYKEEKCYEILRIYSDEKYNNADDILNSKSANGFFYDNEKREIEKRKQTKQGDEK